MFYKLISHVLVTELPNQIQYFSLPGKVSPAKTAMLGARDNGMPFRKV